MQMKLTFFGGAKSVTGSNYLLENGEGRILIDCGLQQGSRYCERQNFNPFGYDPASVDALFVTHAHIDHIGRIPKLYKDGFRGKIFSTPPTKEFAKHLLLDSEHILARDAEDMGLQQMYTEEDVENVMPLWETVKYHESIEFKGFKLEFFDAGHVLGSSFIVITNKDGKKIVFSGDLGNSPAPMIKNLEKVEGVDYALMESTYGARIHEDVKERKGILEDVVEETVKAGGVLMIPSFALERTQELLYELDELVENGRIPKVPVFMDSPLAIRLTEVYRKYSKDPMYFDNEAMERIKTGDAIFDFPGLEFTRTTEESREIAKVQAPKIIIAGAGMSQGGRIIHHEKIYLRDPKNTLFFVGYQAKGSMGRRLLEGAKEVKILGEKVPVRAKLRAVGGYSAHADQPALIDWVRPMSHSLKKLFLVQGEEDQMEPLKHKIMDELAVNTDIPTEGEEVVL
jgi:metallo-beta-lactamase family protein